MAAQLVKKVVYVDMKALEERAAVSSKGKGAQIAASPSISLISLSPCAATPLTWRTAGLKLGHS